MNSIEAIAKLSGADYQAVAALANTLGIAVEQLWGCLIRQAGVNCFCLVLGIAMSGFVLSKWIPFLKKKVTKQEGQNYPDWDDEIVAIPVTLTAIATVFWVIFLFYGSYEIITCIFNPEYWALEKVLTFK